MNKHISIISQAPFFNGLSDDHLHEIRTISQKKEFKKGELIFSEGDDGKGFYIVLKGSIKIFKMSPDGKEQILHFFQDGEVFGEVAVFSGISFPANALALKKSDVLFFPKTAFIELIAKHPSLTLNMLGVLSKRLRQFTTQIENLSLKEIPGRIAAYLLYLSDEQNNAHQVELEISKGQLASLLGTIPETLSRILTKMTDQGLIEVTGRYIKIITPEDLQYLAEYGKLEKY